MQILALSKLCQWYSMVAYLSLCHCVERLVFSFKRSFRRKLVLYMIEEMDFRNIIQGILVIDNKTCVFRNLLGYGGGSKILAVLEDSLVRKMRADHNIPQDTSRRTIWCNRLSGKDDTGLFHYLSSSVQATITPASSPSTLLWHPFLSSPAFVLYLEHMFWSFFSGLAFVSCLKLPQQNIPLVFLA